MKKEITIEQLAKMMEKGFAETREAIKIQGKEIGELRKTIKIQGEDLRKTIKESIEELAIMTNKAFNDTYKRFDMIDKRFDAMSEQNRREHEEIQLRLTNVAYRFELEELKHRVEQLEKKTR